MPPIQCLFLRIQPTADIRLRFKSNGEDYPPNIPHHISQILELQLVSIFHWNVDKYLIAINPLVQYINKKFIFFRFIE
jgi:hypothetical protein